MKHVRVRAAMSAAAVLAIAAAGAGTAQAAPSFGCEASALRIQAIGMSEPVEPAVVGRGEACATRSVAPVPALPAVSLQAVASTTYDATAGTGSAMGGVADLKVVPTADVLAQLPVQQAIDALQPVTASLSQIFLPPLPDIPLPVLLDVRKAVQDKLELPAAIPGTLLSAQVVSAEANVACASGSARLSGASHLAGVSLLGQEIPLDGPLQQTITLLGAQSIPVSALAPEKITILDPVTKLPLAGPLLTQAQTALASQIRTITTLLPPLPATTLDVALTPGGQVVEGDTLTQRALTAKVDLGGIHLVHAALGEAKVSASPGTCALPVKEKPPVPDKPADEGGVEGITATGSVADQILACSDRRLVLVDVLRQGSMVKLLGAANRDYAGKTVAIRLRATNHVVAHATVRKDGSFQTTAPLPPKRWRTPAKRDLVRYSAELGKERSLPLKLQRRMVVSRMASHGGKVTIAGRVLGPLTRPATTIRLMRRVNCKEQALVTTFKPRADGRFTVTVDAPEGQVAAVYRMTTQVRANRHNPKRFPTFTLPRGVALDSR